MDDLMKKTILELTAISNHEKWCVLMRFGLKTLIENSDFLFELILLEVKRQIERREHDSASPSEAEIASHIFNELGLKFVITDTKREES